MGFIGKAAAVIKRRIRMPKLSSGDRNSMHSGKLSKLEPCTELDPNTVWLDSTLMKRGFYANSTFHLRHIKLTSEFISYSQTDGGSLLDRVWFNDIAGVVFHGMKDEEFEQMFNAQEEFAAERQAAHDLYATLKPMQFAVCCTKDGYHKGRQFIFMASSVGEMEVWVASIVRVFKYNMARDTSYQKISTFAACRRYVRWLYLGDRVQLLVAALIVLNFFLNICDTQLQAEEGTLEYKMLEVADIAFGYIFAFELVVNMFATLVTEFVKDPWNWFDALVVGITILSQNVPGIPGISVLRLLRTFRVFRLFKRIPSLKQILICLQQSVPPMCNAFAIVCLVTCIYAIMAVTFYGNQREDLFGDFFSSLFTMFQIMTGDQWGDITRELFAQSSTPALTAMFFVSYQLLVSFVLVNVVIAVLLDEFAKAASSSKAGSSGALQLYVPGNPDDRCPLENVSRDLVNFIDLDDLEHRIVFLFMRVVRAAKVAGGEAARLDEAGMYQGFLGMGTVPPILFEKRHWERFVVRHRLCDSKGTLGLREFMILIKQGLRRYQLRELTSVMDGEGGGWTSRRVRCALATIKGMLVEEAQQARDFDSGGLVPNSEPGLTARPIRAAASKPLPQVLNALVTDMQRLHERFDQIETEIVGSDNVSGSPRGAVLSMEPQVEEAPEEKTAASNAQEMLSNLFSAGPKLSFAPQMDFSQLPPLPFQTPAPAQRPAMAPGSTLSPTDGALTQRSKPPTARNLHKEGWDFFAAQQANLFKGAAERVPGMDAASSLRTGVLDSFSTFGKSLFPFMRQPTPRAAEGALEISATPKSRKSLNGRV